MLYRKEVTEARKNYWSGKAVLISGHRGHYVIAFTLFFFTAFFFLITSCSYTRRISVSGEVISTPRAVTVFSPQQGFIISKAVKQGEHVIKGQPLYRIDVSRTTTSGVVSQRHHDSIQKCIITLNQIAADIARNRRLTLAMLAEEKNRYESALQRSSEIVVHGREGLKLMKENMDNYGRYQQQNDMNNGKQTLVMQQKEASAYIGA